MRYRAALIPVALAVLLGLAPGPTARAADCRFVLGFAALRELIPQIVGSCLEDEHHDPTNGDGLQATTNGLLVWRKAENVTAFTDGFRTWVQGPFGLQERLNTERFAWEQTPAGGTAAVGFLQGQVTIGPLQPVEQAGVPPPTPSPALCTAQVFIVDAADGATEATRFPLQPDCSYRVSLPPGTYVVRLAPLGIERAGNLPATVQIAPGATTRLDVSIDTGIR
jgi:hypothetical protein